MQTRSKEDLESLMATSPFIRGAGYSIIEIDPAAQTLTMRMPWRSESEGEDRSGIWHGGPIAALIDTAGCFAAIMMGFPNAGTIGLNLDYLRPASGSDLDALAKVRKMGRSYATVEVDVHDTGGKLVAVGRGTFFVIAS